MQRTENTLLIQKDLKRSMYDDKIKKVFIFLYVKTNNLLAIMSHELIIKMLSQHWVKLFDILYSDHLNKINVFLINDS